MRIFLKSLILFVFLWGAKGQASPSWYDNSQAALLPPLVQKTLSHYQDFSLFWWNFVVLEFPKGQEVPFGSVKTVCADTLKSFGSIVKRSPCNILDESTQTLLREWSVDYIRRHPKPRDIAPMLNQALAKASLPMDSEFLNILRKDPWNSLEEYKKVMSDHIGFSFENHQGVFYDPATRRVLIPVQINNPPMQTASAKLFYDHKDDFCKNLSCKVLGFVGPHFSSAQNEMQIRSDVDVVSWVGWVVLLLFVAFFILSKRWRILLLFFPLFISMVFATIVTVLIFGSIHGLALSFGPSIVGLAINYGLFGTFAKKEEKWVWRANLFGLLTTLSIFFVVIFSQLPLLRQLAVFSIAGLIFGCALFYLFKTWFPTQFHEKPFEFTVRKSRVLTSVAFLFLVVGLISPAILKPNLSLQQLNFETPQSHQLHKWTYSSNPSMNPLIFIEDGQGKDITPLLQKKALWADENHIRLENAIRYLPVPAEQEKNLMTWKKTVCDWLPKQPTLKEFFEPYWRATCQNLLPRLIGHHAVVPHYLKDLEAHGNWLDVWFPRDKIEAAKIQQKYPQAKSFVDLLMLFSETLSHELLWMVPLAFLASILFLIIYKPRVKDCLLSLIPFFTGVGCYTLAYFLLGLQVSFITVIGLIMVFGFSLDYGIFVVSMYQRQEEQNSYSEQSVWTSITLSALIKTLGFAPLLFAHHPALSHLGQSLFLGDIGTYIGAAWCTPWFFQRKKKA
jgi:hypothetical protein